MKKIFIPLLTIVLSFTFVTFVSCEEVKIYGANWTPGFIEVASGVSFNGKLIFVSDVNNSRIQVYDNTFKPLFWFGGHGEKDGAFIEITGISGRGENVYITSIDSHSERRGRIQSFSDDGIFKTTFSKHEGREDFLKATELSNGNVVAITEETFCIFSNTGRFLKEYSNIGGEVFLSIKDLVTVSPYGFAFIDKNKRGFFIVDNELREIKSYGEEYVYLPSAIAYGKDKFFVADSSGKIFIYDKDGKFIKSLDSNIYIKAIEVLDNTTLIITSLLKKGVATLNTETTEIKTIQIEPKSELELHWPSAICLDNDNLIYVNDDFTGGVKLINSKDGSLAGKSGIADDAALQVIGVSAIKKEAIYILSENDLSTIYKFNGEKLEKKLTIDKESSFISIKNDSEGNIYVLDQAKNSIFKFSEDTLVSNFKITQKEKISDLYIKDSLYISLNNGGNIVAFDLLSGKIKHSIQLKNVPKNITDFHHFTILDNYIILVSRFDHKIYSFSLKDGSFIKGIGGVGGPKTYSPQSNMQVDIAFEPLKFLFPEEIFYKNGIVYVADSGNGRIQAIPESYLALREIIIELKIGVKKAKIDGKEVNLDVPPIIVNGRTLAPLRFIAESFSANVSWDNKLRKVTIKDNETIIELWIDSKRALVNKKEYSLDVPPIIVNGRTLAPLRFIAESFSANVSWDNKNQIVTIRRLS